MIRLEITKPYWVFELLVLNLLNISLVFLANVKGQVRNNARQLMT